jgi:hypothetical protein
VAREVPDREALIKYLLGGLSARERAEVAERYFGDDDWFDELLDVENELLDKYVRGELSGGEGEAFRQYLARLPDGRQKEAVAGALARLAGGGQPGAERILDGNAPAPASPWQPLLKSLRRPQALLPYFAAACLVALAFALLAQFSQTRRVRTENEKLRARITALESERASREQSARGPQPGAAAESAPQTEAQPGVVREADGARAQPPAERQPSSSALASWTLTPALRSAGSPDRVTLPRGAESVSIRMPVEAGGRPAEYRAVIQTTAGRHRRELAGLRADRAGDSVSLKLPASYFSEAAYKLTLLRKEAGGEELALDFYFTVSKR